MMVDLDKLEQEYVGSTQDDGNDLDYLESSELLIKAVASLGNAVSRNNNPTIDGQLLD